MKIEMETALLVMALDGENRRKAIKLLAILKADENQNPQYLIHHINNEIQLLHLQNVIQNENDLDSCLPPNDKAMQFLSALETRVKNHLQSR